MANVKYGPAIEGLSGTVGGITFSRNRSGPYAKAHATPVNSTTPLQLPQRGNLATIAAQWRTLSLSDQDDWATFAATPPETDYTPFGDTRLLSGFGWFARINLRRLACGQSLDLYAPTATPTPQPLTFTLDLLPSTGDPEDCIVTYTSGDFTGFNLILELAPTNGTGVNVATSGYRMIWQAAPAAADHTDAGANYFARMGATQPGQRYAARLYKQSLAGIRSVPLALFADIPI